MSTPGVLVELDVSQASVAAIWDGCELRIKIVMVTFRSRILPPGRHPLGPPLPGTVTLPPSVSASA